MVTLKGHYKTLKIARTKKEIECNTGKFFSGISACYLNKEDLFFSVIFSVISVYISLNQFLTGFQCPFSVAQVFSVIFSVQVS